MTVLSPAELTLLRKVFRYAYSHDWERDTQGPCGGLERGTRRWEDWDNRHVELDAYGTLDINGMAEVETGDLGVRCTVDILVAVGLLPVEFSSAYQAGYDALEEQGSKLTRELELKTEAILQQAADVVTLAREVDLRGAEIERLKAELKRARDEAATHKVTADSMTQSLKRRVEEARELNSRIATLEAKPTSAPPHYIPPREGLPAPAIHGWNQVAEPTPYAEAGETE